MALFRMSYHYQEDVVSVQNLAALLLGRLSGREESEENYRKGSHHDVGSHQRFKVQGSDRSQVFLIFLVFPCLTLLFSAAQT